MALPHQLQHLVAAGFQAHVDHGQSLFPQGTQLLLRADTDGRRRRITGDALALREQLPNGVQNDIEFLCLPHQRIAVGKEHLVHAAVSGARHMEILQDLLQRTEAEALFLIHAAEGAGIVAAAVSHLHDEAVCLGGRAKYFSEISHTPSFSSAAIFRQTQNTATACSSSSTGGREGAMRMLESRGSLP